MKTYKELTKEEKLLYDRISDIYFEHKALTLDSFLSVLELMLEAYRKKGKLKGDEE